MKIIYGVRICEGAMEEEGHVLERLKDKSRQEAMRKYRLRTRGRADRAVLGG